jgi:CHAT domain-containing protein
MYFLYERAMVFVEDGRMKEASADLRQALSYASDWREAIAPSDSLRSGAEFWLKDVYNAYIDLAERQNAASQAFLAVEEERSASLLQMLRDSVSSGDRKTLSGSYREDLARLRAFEIERIVNPNTSGENRTSQVRQRLIEEETRSAAKFVPASLKKGETFLSSNTLGDVQRRIGPEEAILSIHLGNTGSYVWGLTSSHLEMHRLPPRDALVTVIRQFNRAVQESAQDRDRIGAELYTSLFGHLSRTILRKRSWILTSDDEMFEVPFAALVVGTAQEKQSSSPERNVKPVYLVERHETLRIPSALALLARPTPVAGGPFLAVGDGIYNTADNRWTALHAPSYRHFFSSVFGAGAARSSMELPRLVSSTDELKNCASAWRAEGDTVFLTGPDLSRAKLLPVLLLKPAIIHIAAHVLYPNGKPDEALIHLGLGDKGLPEVLTTKDVSALHANGALVVLSGCSSAAGNSVRGAGVMGLTRAWLLAGARAVVGSRWPVPDDSGDLFRSFYAHLAASNNERSGLSYALQQAELDMLRSGQWRSDPRYWGAFYLLAKE